MVNPELCPLPARVATLSQHLFQTLLNPQRFEARRQALKG
jgi:hypothetical protein